MSKATTQAERMQNIADGRRLAMTIKRPVSGWNVQRVSTHPGEMLQKEFLNPLGLSQNALAMKTTCFATRT